MTLTRLLITCCLAATVFAQESEKPPALGKIKPFLLPTPQTFSLANGTQATLAPFGNIPLVAVSARISFGHANESSSQTWLSDFLMELLKEGTATRTGQQVAEEAARMGGQLTFDSGDDESAITLQVLSEFAPDAVKLIADVLQNPKLPADQMERVRANLLRQLSVELSTPNAQAAQAYAAAIYPNHPYGRLFPAPQQLKDYTLQNVRDFYTANAGAQRTRLYVAGRFDAPAVRTAIETAFTNWSAGPSLASIPPVTHTSPQLIAVDRPGASQSTLRIGLPVTIKPTDRDYLPMAVTDSLLGGAFTSRITQNIREEKGYTYTPRSEFDVRLSASSWAEKADVTTKFTADSIREIRSEVQRLRKEPPTEGELNGIKNYLNGVFVFRNSSNLGIVQQLDFVARFGLGPNYLRDYTSRINAVSRQDVQRLAETYLDFNKMTIVVVGDQTQVGKSITAFQPEHH